ncbi:MAG: hypothetical protein E7633_07285 [Ruminococcaceae bacterium]|nr:hypothetical protein [Oscillospiraceae bacterium]
MSIFKRKLPKNENSTAYRIQMAKTLDGRAIKYCTERKDDVDLVIGRAGSLTIRDGEFLVFSSGDIVMRAKIEDLKASELLSLEGVILTAPDLEHGCAERTIIAYYTYYRK